MIIRQSAFGGDKKLLKGALHCHTTLSDGKGTPEEVMKLHAEKGYNFIAITDHRSYNRVNYAPETGLTLIPGTEIDGVLREKKGRRYFHTVCLGPNDDTNLCAHNEKFGRPDVADQYEWQKYMDEMHAKGNITFYCHPEWSATPSRYFENLIGNFAMEIWNTGSVYENDMDKNAMYWDELLGQGKRIWGVAVDDGHAMWHHCQGWVMVNSENDVHSILDALKAGSFYSSCGPVIRDFYVEDGVVHIETEPCDRIVLCSDAHPSRIYSNEDGTPITHVEKDLKGDYSYIRAVAINRDGLRAWTNPIFLD